MSVLNVVTEIVTGLFGVRALPDAPRTRLMLDTLSKEAEAAVDAQRAAARESLIKSEAALYASVLTFQPVRADLIATIEEKRTAVTAAIDAMAQREHEQAQLCAPFENEIARNRRVLAELAVPELKTFEAELLALVPATCDGRDVATARTIDDRERVLWTNAESVTRRIDAIRAAIAVVRDALWLEGLNPAQARERIDAIRQSLPALDRRPRKYATIADTPQLV